MNRESIYYKQVKLLIRMLPIVATEDCFALKGGTAINLFVREFPRLSVDIDLAYTQLEPRNEALKLVRDALSRIANEINSQHGTSATLQDNQKDELRIIVRNEEATIKIEVSPVSRGTIHQPEVMQVAEAVEDEFGYAEIAMVSLPDLYGGKICAALDRQHPRDLYDIKMLLKEDPNGISRDIFVGFLTYALSHPRPIHEVLSPRWKDLNEPFAKEFQGMTFEEVSLDEIEAVRAEMLSALRSQFNQKDHDFLMSFKAGKPDWTLFDVPSICELPAVRWKLVNIEKLAKNNAEKHSEQLNNLAAVLSKWLT